MVELIKMRQKLRSLFIYYSNSNQNIASKKGPTVLQTFNQKQTLKAKRSFRRDSKMSDYSNRKRF